MTLIETIDRIKELRRQAKDVLTSDLYDPQGCADREAKELRAEADALEREMELRLGWVDEASAPPVPLPTKPAPSEGWAHPINERKAHYYVESRSLCRRKLYFGTVEDAQPLGESPREDDCKTCWRECLKREVVPRLPASRRKRQGSP